MKRDHVEIEIRRRLAESGSLPLDKQQLKALADLALLENGAEWMNSYDRLVEANEIMAKTHEELVESAQFAAKLLAKIPAFGDSIGTKVSKAQLGIAHSRLMLALTKIATP